MRRLCLYKNENKRKQVYILSEEDFNQLQKEINNPKTNISLMSLFKKYEFESLNNKIYNVTNCGY